MVIYLVRHGIAMAREDPECPPDPERRLTQKGIARTREVAEAVKEMGVKPDLLLSSPYLRALETAEIFAAEFDYPKERIKKTDALRVGARPAAIFRELTGARAEQVMCFGHAPHLDEAIAMACGAGEPFTALKKGGVACLEMERLTPPRAQLAWIVTPKLLRALAG